MVLCVYLAVVEGIDSDGGEHWGLSPLNAENRVAMGDIDGDLRGFAVGIRGQEIGLSPPEALSQE